MIDLKNGTLIAIAAGMLFAAGCSKDKSDSKASSGGDDKTAKVHCKGINDCKAKGACKTADNACGGQNACKGKGFIDVTEQECKDKNGSIIAGDPMAK
jgi:hypothetical protein